MGPWNRHKSDGQLGVEGIAGMNSLLGHALLVGAAALGAGLSLELIAAETRPVRAGAAVVTGSTAPSPVRPVILEGAPLDREQLTRALQKELRRVGCYAGEITGSWGPSSRHAMRMFADKMQVRLPIEAPDHVLLKLVQQQKTAVCLANAEPRLIAPPKEAKRPPAKRPAAQEGPREDTAAAAPPAPPLRTGSMLPRAGTYSAPPNRTASSPSENQPPPRLVRALMKGVAGALTALEWP